MIIVPKVKSPRDVWFVDDLLTRLERKLGLEVGGIGLELLIEESEALSRIEEIAGSSDRLAALVLGVGDLSASLGMRIGGSDFAYPGDIWHYARNRMISAARTHDLAPIDGPYADFADPDGCRREATTFTAIGGVGKWCIHRSQISIANEVFAPTEDEIKLASGITTAVREAEEQGIGAANYQGIMVDAATTRIFAGVLDRARQCGLL